MKYPRLLMGRGFGVVLVGATLAVGTILIGPADATPKPHRICESVDSKAYQEQLQAWRATLGATAPAAPAAAIVFPVARFVCHKS